MNFTKPKIKGLHLMQICVGVQRSPDHAFGKSPQNGVVCKRKSSKYIFFKRWLTSLEAKLQGVLHTLHFLGKSPSHLGGYHPKLLPIVGGSDSLQKGAVAPTLVTVQPDFAQKGFESALKLISSKYANFKISWSDYLRSA